MSKQNNWSEREVFLLDVLNYRRVTSRNETVHTSVLTQKRSSQ